MIMRLKIKIMRNDLDNNDNVDDNDIDENYELNI